MTRSSSSGDLAQRILVLRGDRSQREWAEEIGVGQQRISAYENGAEPGIEFLRKLHEVEGVDLNWLVTGKP